MTVVSQAVLKILIDATSHLGSPGWERATRIRFLRLRSRAGMNCQPADREWIASHVETPEQAELLEQALRRIVDLCTRGRSGKPLTEKEITERRHGPTIAKQLLALTWLASPAALGGRSVRELAEALGIHVNSLSLYTAEMSRRAGHRIHAQSKGWNFNFRPRLANGLQRDQEVHHTSNQGKITMDEQDIIDENASLHEENARLRKQLNLAPRSGQPAAFEPGKAAPAPQAAEPVWKQPSPLAGAVAKAEAKPAAPASTAPDVSGIRQKIATANGRPLAGTTISRDQFDALNQKERGEFFKAGGRVA
jgi:hypothetical protein